MIPVTHRQQKEGNFAADFQRLKNAVLAKRFVLKEIIEKRGSKLLVDYTQEYIDVNLNPPIQQRQNEFLETFEEEVQKIFGTDIATKARSQLAQHYFVSTADHMGPVCHPCFINASLVTAAACIARNDKEFPFLIVLPCASISFDNHTFPRGLQFHSAIDPTNPPLHSVGFFGRSVRPLPVFGFRGYGKEDMDRATKQLQESVREKKILPQEMESITALFQEVYLQPEIMGSTTFGEQMAKANMQLWRRYFRHHPGTMPDLLYIEQEQLVSKLICKYHLDADTTISHILFDRECDELIFRYFEGIQGAFSRDGQWGTYLFWGLPPGSKYRMQLWKQGNALVSADGSYRLELTPDNLRRALESREILPSTLMDFIVLSFYYGLKCLGGFNQVNYLTLMKNAYIRMQLERGKYRSIEVCARAQTKEICDGFSVAFLGYGEKMTVATGLDLLLHGTKDTLPTIQEVCRSINVEEALNPLMSEIYRTSYPEQEWDPTLSGITAEEISCFTGLDTKIRACVRLT